MELPNIGQHCSEVTCNLLDFLPIKCDACRKVFCKDHYTYSTHNCPSIKDVQVPMCPLCNKPIPVNRNEIPDIKVGEHIDRDCRSKPKKKVFTYKCTATGCKKKELVGMKCDSCKQNYCLKHRHPHDHDCQYQHSNATSTSSNMSYAGAIARQRSNQNMNFQKNSNELYQPSMNEDEALARALQMSMLDATPKDPQESEDHQLAKALAKSEEEYRKRSHKSESSCNLS